MRRRALLPLVPFVAACAAPPPPLPARCPPSVAPDKPSTENNAAPPSATEQAGAPRIRVAIQPLSGAGSIDVVMTLDTRAAAFGNVFSIRAPDPEAFRMKEAADVHGAIAFAQHVEAGRVVVELSHPPEGKLSLAYTALSRVPSGKLPWMLSDPDRLEVSGDALLLPNAEVDSKITADLQLDLSSYGTLESGASVSGAASSFGIGASREVSTTVRELRGAAFVAGRMGTAVFDTLEGHDEAAWFGYTAFDPRPVSADTAAFRTAAGEFFGDRSPEPHMLLIVPDSRPPGSFVAARRSRSVLVHVAVSEPWSGPLRITTAVEVLHAWLGERLWIGPEDPARAAEGTWFDGGVARHLARDMLFRFGLVTPSEVADEVNGLEAVIATSPHAKKSNAELAAHANEPFVMPLLVARGALYALSVDAALRAQKKKENRHELSDVLRALYTRAKERRGPLPTEAWTSALTDELGKGAAESFVAAIERGGEIDLPDGALGPCFRKEKRRYVRYDLGFDEAATRARTPPAITGLRPGGPAAKAGLREGDVLVEAKTTPGRSDVPVTIIVERGGEDVAIRYEPAGAAAEGRGWARRKDVPDESCTK